MTNLLQKNAQHSRMLIIDGDVFAYHACRPRWLKKAYISHGLAHIELDENGKKKELEFTPEEDAKYLEESWKNFKDDIQYLCDHLYATHYIMAVGGRDNFRFNMYPEYKANRHKEGVKQNEFVPIIRQRAVEENMAVFADYREADDYIRTWAEEAKAANIDYIICSIDKDLKCIPGKFFDPRKDKAGKFKHKVEEISETKALKNYYEQLLKGDPTDNIPGISGLGPKTATKLLALCKTEEEMQEVVVDEYMKSYGFDKWKDYLLSNGKMIHLQKNLNDYFSISNWNIVKELE